MDLNLYLLQLNPKLGALEENFVTILEKVKSQGDKHHIIVCPDYALTGAPVRDLLHRKDYFLKTNTYLKKLGEETKAANFLLIFGSPVLSQDNLNRCALALYRGEYFTARKEGLLLCHSVPQASTKEITLMKSGIFCFAVTSLEEILTTSEEVSLYKALKVNFLIVLSALPYEYGRFVKICTFLKEKAKELRAYLVYTNLAGLQEEFIFEGRSLIISPDGEILAQAKAFVEDDIAVTLPLQNEVCKHDELPSAKGYQVPFKEIFLPLEKEVPRFFGKKEDSLQEEAEIYEALKCAIRDYVVKSNFKGVVLGLSGGIDSALVAALATDALGSDRVIALFMPSEFTSRESYEDAKEVAYNLGLKLIEVPINKIFNVYREEIKENLGYNDFTVADENLQARIRANLLFYLSNKEDYLVLNTSNKSEAATGYGTLYGDIAGGFAPLKDIYKTWVYKLARYRNTLRTVFPERLFTKPPSAELKPGQKDEDDLPPYEILDKILYLHLEEELTPEEIIAKGFQEEVVKKVMRMLTTAEFKRRQAPIGPKITKKTLGVDYKLPISILK
ncbi:MAG: NAD+ synthase [Caldimicrobium sp.]